MRQIFIVIILLILFSCKKEFDLRPETRLVPSEHIFQSEQGLETYSNGFYNYLDIEILDDENSDNCATASALPDIISGIYSMPTTLGSAGWDWGRLRDINYFLDNIEQYTQDLNLKNEFSALGRFFRALFYFNKVRSFGDVPYYDHIISESDSSELFGSRDSRVLVMDKVLDDLDFAISHLTDKKSKNKITKWTALAYKSRIALFEGSFRKYHAELNLPNSEKFLEEASDAARQIIDAGVYTLYSSGDPQTQFAEIFQLHDVPTDEVILARSSTENFFYYTPTFTGSSHGNFGGSFSLISDFANLDGSSYYTSKMGNIDNVSYFEEFENRDYRLRGSIVFPGYIRIGTNSITVNDFTNTLTGYQITKRVGPPIEDQGSDDRDNILFRYAEVLLNYAEARAILGELNQEDIDLTLNPLRQRAGITGKLTFPLKTDELQLSRYRRTSDPNVLEVCRERRVELAFEGFRRYDLIRWNEGHLFRDNFEGIFVPGLNQFIDLDQNGKPDVYFMKAGESRPTNVPSGVQIVEFKPQNTLTDGNSGRIILNSQKLRSFEDWEYLKPIPTEELTLNSNLEQNPHWDQVK